MFINQIKTFLIGFLGLTASIGTELAEPVLDIAYSDIVTVIVQIVVGIATLYKLLSNQYRDKNS